MAFESRQAAFGRPATVAVHDQRDMARDAAQNGCRVIRGAYEVQNIAIRHFTNPNHGL
jgi:hypothetical protein